MRLTGRKIQELTCKTMQDDFSSNYCFTPFRSSWGEGWKRVRGWAGGWVEGGGGGIIPNSMHLSSTIRLNSLTDAKCLHNSVPGWSVIPYSQRILVG